jgi:hypothetical protein
MISAPDRQRAVTLIDEARAAGARLEKACGILQISARTYQRWTTDGTVRADGRPEAERPRPAHALSPEERDAVIEVCNRPENADRPPTQIVPKLADEGQFIASESTFYRILRQVGQQHHRGRAKSPKKSGPPSSHTATAPNQIWCWDITWLSGPIRGQFFFLYLILDLYNHRHHHRGIQFVTPDQRHRGEDHAILAKRHEVYQAAKARNPNRWTSNTRNWDPVGHVHLNPISDHRRYEQAA